MPMTVTEIKNLKPRDNPYKRGDEKGLYLEIMANGAKYWRFKYRRPSTRKENRLCFGSWPKVSFGPTVT